MKCRNYVKSNSFHSYARRVLSHVNCLYETEMPEETRNTNANPKNVF